MHLWRTRWQFLLYVWHQYSDAHWLVTELWLKLKKLFLRVKALRDTHLAQTLLTYSDSGSDLLSECRHSPEQEWASRCVLSARTLKQRNSLPYTSSKYQSNFVPHLDTWFQNFFQFIFRKKKTDIFAGVVNTVLCCICEVKNSTPIHISDG